MGAGPASFPVALSDGSMTSMSRLSSVSPVKQRRARHPRLPASAPIRGPYRLGIPRSACCVSDVEDTADSGSPQTQLRSSVSARAREGSGSPLRRGVLEAHFMRGETESGGSASTTAGTNRPQRQASEPTAGATGGRAPLSRAMPEREGESNSGHSAAKPAGTSSVSMQPRQPPPATDVGSPRMAGGNSPVPVQRRQSEGSGVGEAQVPALEKLKRRMQRRQRTSLQDASVAPALQARSFTGRTNSCHGRQLYILHILHRALQLSDSSSAFAAGCTLPMTTASCALTGSINASSKRRHTAIAGDEIPEADCAVPMPVSVKGATTPTGSKGGSTHAREPATGATGISEVPAEEQLVFRPSRALPRSPVRDRPSPHCNAECSQEALKQLSPSRADTVAAASLGVKGLVQRIEAEETIRCSTPALSPASPVSTPPTAMSASVQPCAGAAAPELARPGRDSVTPPRGNSFLQDGASKGKSRRHSQPNTAVASQSVFTPSHVLARSPPKQVTTGPKSPQGVSAGQPSPVRSPKQPARPGAALPKGSPPASADERSPQRQLRTRSELLEADKKPQGANGKCASPTVELVIRCGLVQVLHGPCLLPCRYKAVCNISVVAR